MESDKTIAYLLPHGIHRMSGSMILIHLWKRSIVSPFSLDFLGDRNQDPFRPFVAASSELSVHCHIHVSGHKLSCAFH